MSTLAVVLGSGGIGAVLAAIVNWAASRSQVRVDHFRAIVDALNRRIDDLQEEVEQLREMLEEERVEHGGTRRVLTSALRYIRALWGWLDSGQPGQRPPPPEEIRDEL